MSQLGEALLDLLLALVNLLVVYRAWLVPGILLLAWVVWWLWGVNWSRTWPWLRQGAWAPLVLLILTAALVWSQLAPQSCDWLGFLTVPNFWWQLSFVASLVCVALFCGWLQGYFGWAPAEIELEPPSQPNGPNHGQHHPHH